MSVESEKIPLLEMQGISKTFFGIRALDNVSLSVFPGEVHSLMGENGAGKSTLMKILSGAYIADPGGEIRIDGKPVTISDTLSAKALGISVIYQEICLAPNLTVAENIFLGKELRHNGMIDRKAMIEACAPELRRLGATFVANEVVSRLSIAEQQMVEIARALHSKSRILVMDEPTTALSSRETEKLFQIVKQLRQEGMAIIYISHRMQEVYDLSDRVSVLRDGGYVGTLVGKDKIVPDTIVRMMVGRDISSFYQKKHVSGGTDGHVVLDVKDLGDDRRVKSATFSLRAGEVLGLAGLVGSGRTELARLIFGAEPRTHGEILLEGKALSVSTPGDAMRAGIAYLTEDRKAQGLFLDMSVHDNINLAVIEGDAKVAGVLNRTKAKGRSGAAIKALAIRVPSPLVEVGSLSGGNQQKVLLSRLLETKPKVLILDEPTRGVDVGAKSEIYRIIDDLAKRGVAVLVISSELPEIIGIADRVLVMREGHISGVVGRGTSYPVTQEAIMAFATGVAANEAPSAAE